MTRITAVLTENFADWEVGHVLAAMRTYYGAEVTIATPDGAAVTSSGGMQVSADTSITDANMDETDVLIICGGPIWSTPDAPDLSELLSEAIGARKVVAAVCGAVGALAANGLLNAVEHTGNSLDEIESVPNYSGQSHFRDVPGAVSDQRIITASGTAPVSFMAEIARAMGHGGANLDYYVGMLGAEHRAAA